MSHELKEGLRLKSVVGIPNGEEQLHMRLGSYSHHCKSIVVVMQPGQMGMVPWARAELNNGSVEMINLASIESIELEPSA